MFYCSRCAMDYTSNGVKMVYIEQKEEEKPNDIVLFTDNKRPFAQVN